MKRIFSCLSVLLLLALCLSGCTAAPQTEEAPPASPAAVHEAPSSAAPPAWADGKTLKEMPVTLDLAFLPTMENVQAHAECAVRGTVTAISYTVVNGLPWTILRTAVTEVVGGKAAPAVGEAVDVYTFGGYITLEDVLGDARNVHGGDMSAEEAAATVLHYTFDGSDLPLIGGEYVFYLTRSQGDGELNGQYERLCGSYGQLQVDGDHAVRRGYEQVEAAQQSIPLSRLVF